MRLALLERCDLDRRALVGLSVLVLLASGYAVQHFWLGRPEPVGVPERESAAAGASGPSAGSAVPGVSGRPWSGSAPAGATVGGSGASGASGGAVVVDVAGRVARPGVRTLPAGARVHDALAAAGGALPGTDTTAINLARRLADGEEIVVGLPVAAGAAPAGSGAGAAGGAALGGPAGGPVSLATATAQQLDTLPGVGPVLAQRIIQYRDRHGGFRSVQELQQVPGLGDRRFSDLKSLVRP
jgi:competence protein ComEA